MDQSNRFARLLLNSQLSNVMSEQNRTNKQNEQNGNHPLKFQHRFRNHCKQIPFIKSWRASLYIIAQFSLKHCNQQLLAWWANFSLVWTITTERRRGLQPFERLQCWEGVVKLQQSQLIWSLFVWSPSAGSRWRTNHLVTTISWCRQNSTRVEKAFN